MRRRLSSGKRLAFGAILFTMVWGFTELSAWPVYWAIVGKPFSWSGLQAERKERANRPAGVGQGVFSQVHPYVGYVQEPSPNSGVVRLADGLAMPVSNYGYIDDKLPIQKRAPGRVVVGILGGSVASYFGVNGVQRLETLLKQSPGYAGKDFVFLNLALGGYKQPQQLATLAYMTALGAEFDLVLNIDGFNEVALHELENASHQVFPAFPRSWHARIGMNDPVVGAARARLNGVEESRNMWARWVSDAPWRWSIVCNLIWKLRDRRLEWDAYSIVKAHQELRDQGGPYVATGPNADLADRDALFQHLATIWANSSLAMDALCRGRGTRYIHVLQPNQYLADSKPMDAAERRTAYKEDHPYRRGVETGYPLLIQESQRLKENGVAFHDLTGLFRDHPESLYIDDCCHFNQAGLEIMAEAVASAVLAEPLDEPRP